MAASDQSETILEEGSPLIRHCGNKSPIANKLPTMTSFLSIKSAHKFP